MVRGSQLCVPDTRPLQQAELLDLKSEGAAFRFSLLETLIPLALGTAIIATSSGGDYSDSDGSAEAF